MLPVAAQSGDIDQDGIPDAVDNCTLKANADQRDSNLDGFGNLCDADFDGNGIVDPGDYSLLKSRFGKSGFPDQDLNGNGVVDPFDFSLLKLSFGQPPGPAMLDDTTHPWAVNNIGSQVGEGKYDLILFHELAYADDAQATNSITYTVTREPVHGQLVLMSAPETPVQVFSQFDLNSGRIAYRHHRGNAETDSFEFSVDDGQGNVLAGQNFAIRVVANVRNLNINYDLGAVTLNWSSPPGSDVDGIEIRRGNDGHYPQNPVDGTLVVQVPVGQQVAADTFIPTGGLGETAYYSVFSYNAQSVYSDGVRVGVYCDNDNCMTVPDLRELVEINSVNDVGVRRKGLISAIWGVDTLPAQMPVSVTELDPPENPNSENTFDYRPPNAVRTEQLLVDPGDDFFNNDFQMRLYSAAAPNGKLIIYHGGHRGLTDARKSVIERFLAEEFYVLEISMPMAGFNYGTRYHPPYGMYHEDIAALERPMRFFFEQVSVALNYLSSVRGFNDIYMTGISGGGWTTVVYAALDPRIKASYPVAGSYPFYVRSQMIPSMPGDFEQTNPGFYQNVTYLELYLLGSAGRRQLHVYNVFDDCCFSGTYSNTFKDYIQTEAAKIGGSLDIVLDDTFIGHKISDYAIEIIVNDIATNSGR